MDCDKVIEIYKKTCNKKYVLETSFINQPSQHTQIEFEKLNLKADKICLQAMETMYKFCDMNYVNKK